MTSYTVTATNWATASENKIHDDNVARQFGFGGGLVPGVTLYAYLTRPMVELWGTEWLGHGGAEVRFASPVYDGDTVTTDLDPPRLELRNSAGSVCASGSAWVDSPPVEVPDVGFAPLPASRPEASTASLEVGTVLGSVEHRFDATQTSAYLEMIGDEVGIYRTEGIAHPGWLLLDANQALVANVVLGPWIHVGSRVHNLRAVTDGQQISTRSRVAAEYERKGHRFVKLDVVTMADDDAALVVRHTAIWRLRPPS
ncbi:MAG: hypothetical protein NVS3B12_00260 [Acidimicrobiales bacterium]